jgi:putative Holliday junction resolvase
MPTATRKRLLAIDYGTKRIGLAKSDLFQMFAQPVGTFDREGLFRTITEIVTRDGVEKIIVGYPLNEQGEQTRMTSVVDKFIKTLQEVFPQLTIETVNEYGSSKSAEQVLIASGVRKTERGRKGRLDSTAASLLLQDYLTVHRASD